MRCLCLVFKVAAQKMATTYLFCSQALLKTPTNRSPSSASFVRCSIKDFRSPQNSSVATISFPLITPAPKEPGAVPADDSPALAKPFSLSVGGATAGGLATGVFPAAGLPVAAAAPPITMTPNSTSVPASVPITSSRVLESVTGFFLYRILILAADNDACVAYCCFRS